MQKKSVELLEFQFVESDHLTQVDNPISSQFDKWKTCDFDKWGKNFKALQMTSHVIKNSDGRICETLFILYEYEDKDEL